MGHTSGLWKKRTFGRSHVGRSVFLAGFFVSALAIMLWPGIHSSSLAFAATLIPSKNTFAVSPTQGPVGAVISVSGNGVMLADGTQVNVGYTVNYRTCDMVSGSQSGVVHSGAFSGWFRWPASTGTGTFGVCAVANGAAFQVGNYQVLSASAPQVSLAPTSLKAGHQATVSGENFLPGGVSVNLIWRSANGGRSVLLGTATSDASGAFVHTFTVPVHASTGSYTLTGVVGSGSPPALSAATTSHVDGVTIVAVPTPTVISHPTVTPASVPTTAPTTASSQLHPPVNPAGASTENKAGLVVPIALGGGLLIILALGAGVIVVRRQRQLMTPSPGPSSGLLAWPGQPNMMAGGANAGAGAMAPWPGQGYPAGQPPVDYPGNQYAPSPGPAMSHEMRNKVATIPFDPGLAEAMREAQVSLFATPRPPASEIAEIQ